MSRLKKLGGGIYLAGGKWLFRRGREGYKRLTKRERGDLSRLLRKSRGRRART